MNAIARDFQFVEERYDGSTPAISCDGLVPGAGLDLSHWQGNRTPQEYKADTSTEIALRFAADPEAAKQWAGALAVNNHFDTDGALSAWVLLEPDRARACRDLLIAAAEAGDFDEWPALDEGLWLDAAIRAIGTRAGSDAAAYDAVLPQLGDLIDDLASRRDLWGREWDDLQAAAAALESGRLLAECKGSLAILLHPVGQVEAPAPLLARRFLPGARRYLLAFERAAGRFDYRFERPHYAWADTVVRPVLAAPDARALAAALGPQWTDQALPGMTGIIKTSKPVADDPHAVADKLAQLYAV